jgi:hypothetical protein
LAGQHPVKQHQVGQHGIHRRLGLVGRGRNGHLVACVAQVDRNELGDRVFVFHHQDAAHVAALAWPAKRRTFIETLPSTSFAFT